MDNKKDVSNNELLRYQKYLKSIKNYDPLDEEEYLYLTMEMNKIIRENEKLSDTEVLELTKKLDKIDNTEDYTVELLELTKEIKNLVKKYDIPKPGVKANPSRKGVKTKITTPLLPKILPVVKKEEKPLKKIESLEKEEVKNKPLKPQVRNVVEKKEKTLKELVDNNKGNENIKSFDTTTIKKIRDSINETRKVNTKLNKKHSKKEKMLWLIIFLCSLLALLYMAIEVIRWELDNRNVVSQINDIYESVNVVEMVNKGAITDVGDFKVEPPKVEEEKPYERPNDYWYYMSMSMIDVDFKSLQKINKDTKGWIQVAGTNINYPYVQTNNNDYYLKHSFNKSYNSAGWVYQDYRNNASELSRNNIIYAHGRLDNTMFGSLKKVVNPSWYNNANNLLVKTSTLKYNAIWQVFSTYTILPESYYIKTKFTDSEYDKFLNTITSRSVHDYNVEVDIDDKILTLSSCYSETKRVVLHAKLIRYEEK